MAPDGRLSAVVLADMRLDRRDQRGIAAQTVVGQWPVVVSADVLLGTAHQSDCAENNRASRLNDGRVLRNYGAPEPRTTNSADANDVATL